MPVYVMVIVLTGSVLHAVWNGLVKGGSDRYLDTLALLGGAAAICLCALPFLKHISSESWGLLWLSAIIHVVYFTLIALSYQHGEMSVVYPVTRGAAPALTAIGSLLMHDVVPAGQRLGTGLISAGVVWLAFQHRPGGGLKSVARPLGLALLNALMIALYTLVDGRGARLSASAAAYTCWDFVLTALLFIPIGLLWRGFKPVGAHIKTHWKRGLLGGAFSTAAYTAALWAMTLCSISSVAALRETSILFGVLFAAHRLKEPVGIPRWCAAAVVAAGAVCIKLWPH